MKLLNWIIENPCIALSSIIAIVLYYPLCKGILSTDPKKKIEQNVATWILWTALDLIAAITIYKNDGNFVLVTAYVAGGTVTSCCILRSCKISWTWVETLSTGLVAICLVVWSIYGSMATVIVSSIAVVIATIPQVVSAWKKPEDNPFLIYIGYIIANTLSLIGGKEWSIEERYYPALCTGACLVTTLCIARKFEKKILTLNSHDDKLRPDDEEKQS